jgi:type IV pilus assembly protein PilX
MKFTAMKFRTPQSITLKPAHMQMWRQRGVVLFIALIALLVMSLAAVALIRSVDTNTMIAGNLALRQSALTSSDRGAEKAMDWLETAALANLATLDGDNTAEGYYATYFPTSDADGDGKTDDGDDRLFAKNLVDEHGVLDTNDDGQGNKIEYIIQRMCLNPAPPANIADESEPGYNKCMLGEPEIGTSSMGVKEAPEAGAIVATSQSPVYRVTVKVTGPKNTVSYTQTYVY